MKKIIIMFIGMVMFMGIMNAQSLQKNSLSIYGGYGFTENAYTVQSFSITYQREITGKLYAIAGYTGIQGSKSFNSIFENTPQLNEFNELGEAYELRNGISSNLLGNLLDVNVFSIGLMKYIQIAPKAYMVGSLSLASNSITTMEVDGIAFAPDNTPGYSNIYPSYGSFHKFGAKVGLEGQTFLGDQLTLNGKIEYLSVLSIIRFSLGTTFTF